MLDKKYFLHSLWCRTAAGPVAPPHWLNRSCWQEASWSNQVGEGSRDPYQQMIAYCLHCEEENYQHTLTFNLCIIRKVTEPDNYVPSPQSRQKCKLTTAKVLIPFPYTLRGMVLGSSFSFSSFIRLGRNQRGNQRCEISLYTYLDTLKCWCVKAFTFWGGAAISLSALLCWGNTEEKSKSHIIAVCGNIVF